MILGKVKLVPVISVFAGMQVVDEHKQINTITDPIEKWRDVNARRLEDRRKWGCLAKFTQNFKNESNSNWSAVYSKSEFTTLVVQFHSAGCDPINAFTNNITILSQQLPIKYSQWGIIRLNEHLFERDVWFEVETITVGTNEFDFTELDVADILNLEKVYTEYDMRMLADKAQRSV